MTGSNRLTLALIVFLTGWNLASPVTAQNIQSPFTGSRPFAPSAPQGKGPDAQQAPSGSRPFAPPVRPEVLREQLLTDLGRWSLTPLPLALDRIHCNFSKSSDEDVKVFHDTVQQFVRDGKVPANMTARAGQAALEAIRQAGNGPWRDQSPADLAACCRAVAAGANFWAGLARHCPGGEDNRPTNPWQRPSPYG